jgi:GTPase SAR1 family protein
MYYRGAHAAILVYDITNDESLNDIQVWLDGRLLLLSGIAMSIQY